LNPSKQPVFQKFSLNHHFTGIDIYQARTIITTTKISDFLPTLLF